MNRVRRWLRKNNWTTCDPWSEVFVLVIIPGLYLMIGMLLLAIMSGRI